MIICLAHKKFSFLLASDSAAIITNTFTAVINASVLDALDAWKEARVIPLFKKKKSLYGG